MSSGTRTFLESEVSNTKMRKDLYDKMVAIDPSEATEEEKSVMIVYYYFVIVIRYCFVVSPLLTSLEYHLSQNCLRLRVSILFSFLRCKTIFHPCAYGSTIAARSSTRPVLSSFRVLSSGLEKLRDRAKWRDRREYFVALIGAIHRSREVRHCPLVPWSLGRAK